MSILTDRLSKMETPRDKWNALGLKLGLTVLRTGTDGWVALWERPDGLHIWRVIGTNGNGIQTAIVRGGHYQDHKGYYGGDKYANLTEAAERVLP